MRIVSARASSDHRPFRIALLLREVNARVNARIAEALRASGLTLPQTTALRLIAHAGSLTMSELASEMNATPSTVAGIVDRLVAAGIVVRQADPTDRRIVRATLSPDGGGRTQEVRAAVEGAFTTAFSNLSEAELLDVERGLESILAGLRRAGKEA